MKRFRRRFKNTDFRPNNAPNFPVLMHNQNFPKKTNFFTFICLVNPKVIRTIRTSNPEKKALQTDGWTDRGLNL